VIRRYTLQRWIEAYATWREYGEAKRALANIRHSADCPYESLGRGGVRTNRRAAFRGKPVARPAFACTSTTEFSSSMTKRCDSRAQL
jgi:hypothetical protein